MILITGLLFAVAGFLLGFGDNGRGTKSQAISILAGLIWMSAVIYAFVSESIKIGLIAILASFVISAITMPIGKAVVVSLRNKK